MKDFLRDLKESGLYLMLSIVVTLGLSSLLFFVPSEIMRYVFGTIVGLTVFVLSYLIIRFFYLLFNYPLRSTFFENCEKDFNYRHLS